MLKWYNIGGGVSVPYLSRNPGGEIPGNTPSVSTGVPQGGHAQPAINTYIAGSQAPQYSTGPIGDGVTGQAIDTTQYVQQAPLAAQTPYVPPATTTNISNAGGQGSGPAATEQFVPATVTNQQATYAGETYDTSQDTAGDNTAVGKVTTYTPEQLAEITTDISQSSLIPAEERIAQNQANVDQIVADGGGNISAGPNILDASQSPEQYHQNFQGNYNTQYDHAQANPTGQSTGVPIYEQGFDFSDAGIDALLPPTAEADTSAGSTAWGPLAGVENFLAGIGGKDVQDTRYGVTGNRTAQQQANVDAFGADPTAVGSTTADKGSRSVRATKATEMAQATIDSQRQEDAAAQGDPAAQAALAEDRAKQRLAHTFKSDGHKAAEKAAQAAGIDLSWQDIQDLGKTSHEYSQAGIDSIRAEQQGLNIGGSVMTEEEKRRSAAKIAQSKAQATPTQPKAPLQAGQVKQGGGIGQQIGGTLLKGVLGSALGPLGGILGGLFNQGGQVDLDEIKKQQQARAQASAQASTAGAKQVAPATRALFNAQGQDIGTVKGDVVGNYNRESSGVGNQQDPFAGIAQKIAADKAAGKPVNYKALAALQHAKSVGNEAEKVKAMRAFMEKYPEFAVPGGSQGVVLRNQGGPISGNPHGYNEGGSTQATPIKKVMDMEKLESQKSMDSLKEDQAERSFQMGESRKDEAHQQAMMQKEEAHQQAMKLKKESATMAGPLSGGK